MPSAPPLVSQLSQSLPILRVAHFFWILNAPGFWNMSASIDSPR